MQSARAFFLSLIQGGGIGDPLAPLFTREGVDDEMGGADQTFFHRRRRLDSDQQFPLIAWQPPPLR